MLIHINAAKCVGIDAVPVTVEVDVINGIGIHLVGLAAVKQSLYDAGAVYAAMSGSGSALFALFAR